MKTFWSDLARSLSSILGLFTLETLYCQKSKLGNISQGNKTVIRREVF